MFNLSIIDWLLAVLGAIGIGLSKGAFPGLSLLAVGLYTDIFEPMQSLGIILIILFLANSAAVIIFRRYVDWGTIVKLLPFTLIGVMIGYGFLLFFPIVPIEKLIGIMLILMIGVHFYYNYFNSKKNKSNEIIIDRIFSVSLIFTGLFCGFATMVTNAAGPITVIYLLSIGLDKIRFIGTMAWFYFIVNAIKIPFHVSLGSINSDTLKISGLLGLVAILTVCIAPYLIKHISQRVFNVLTWILVLAASLKLAF